MAEAEDAQVVVSEALVEEASEVLAEDPSVVEVPVEVGRRISSTRLH